MSSPNSFFQSSPIKHSPKHTFKKKLKFNDCSSLLQENRNILEFFNSTGNNDEQKLDFDWASIKSEIDIEEHELPTIKQELETDSNNSSSPKHKKKKHKEKYKSDGLYQKEIDGNPTDKIKEHQTNTSNEFKKPRTYSESDSQNEEHLNRDKEKKKRKKNKNIALNEDLGTETDSSTTSQKHKKKKHKELNSVEDSVLDNISKSKKKNKKDRQDQAKSNSNLDDQDGVDANTTEHDNEEKSDNSETSLTDSSLSKIKKKKRLDLQENVNKKFNGSNLDAKKSNSNLDDQDGVDTNETEHDNEEKANNSETSLTDSSLAKIKKKQRPVRISLQLTFIPESNVQNEVDFDRKNKHLPNQNDEIQNLANEDNAGKKLDNKLFEDNIENPEVDLKRKKKKKKKLKNKENIRNETISETHVNQNETDLDIDSEKPKGKKKINRDQNEDDERNEDEEQNDNLENKSMDQDRDNEIETASKTSSKNSSTSDGEPEDNSKNEKTKMTNEENFFEMNSSSDEISDNNKYKQAKTQKTVRSPKNRLLETFRKNPEQINDLKKKIEIISNELVKKSTLDKSVKKKKSPQSLFAQRFEDYSSNDECDSRFEPQVDHNTTLEDVLEKSEDNDTHLDFLEQCGSCITVKIPFDVPKIHLIEGGIALLSEKDKEAMKSLGFKIKTGPFSRQDDETLLSNWKEFCKVHDVPENPAPFISLKFLKKIMTLEDRMKFVRFLARNLNNRTLYSVYRRFCTIMNAKSKRRGRFTPEEDRIILDYLTKTDDKHPYRKLAKILNRNSALIHKRVVKLTNNGGDNKEIKWSKEILEDVVRNLLKVTEIDDIHVFRKRPVTLNEWKKVSQIMNIPALKLKYAWECRIYRELFYEYDEISTADIRKKLIDRLYEMNITDFRTIDWIELAKEFDGLSSTNICKFFHTILRYHVPKNYHNKPKECLEYLKNELLSTYQFVDKKLKKVYLNI